MKYLVVTTRRPNPQQAVIDAHYVYLEELRTQGRLEMWGPFTDKTGGAYILNAASFAEAEALVAADPIIATGTSDAQIREWNAK